MQIADSDKPLIRQVLRELRRGTSDPDRQQWVENFARSFGVLLDVVFVEPVRGDRRAANPHRQRRRKL